MFSRIAKCEFKIIIVTAFFIYTALSITTAAANEAEIAFKQGPGSIF